MREATDTRTALLGAAASLLEGGGLEAVTLRAVGERAGVSRQAPYKHFADKKELLSVIAAGYFGQVGAKMAGAAEAADGSFERLDAMVAAYLRFALENRARTRLMFGSEIKSNSYPTLHEAARAVYERFVGAVSECQKAGLLPGEDPVELAALVYAAAHGAVDLTLSGHTEEAKGLGDPLALIRLLLSYLRTR